jgi:hypothetical protein
VASAASPDFGDSPADGANGHAEDLGTFGLTLALVQEGFKLGQGIPVQ